MWGRTWAAWRLPPPFIGQGEAAYKRVVWCYTEWQCTGVQCSWCNGRPGGFLSLGEFMVWRRIPTFVGGMVAPVLVQRWLRVWSWPVFVFGCRPYTGSRMRPCLFEGLTEGRAFRCTGADVVMSHHRRMPQRRGWPYNTGDGRTTPAVMETTCSASFAPRRHTDCVPGRRPYTFRGCPRALSRGSMREEDRSGRHNVLEWHWLVRTGLVQCLNSAGAWGWMNRDGSWPHSDGVGFPRGARRWRGKDSPFDHGDGGRSEHLMPLSGETSGAP
jgi:hypothetical protein